MIFFLFAMPEGIISSPFFSVNPLTYQICQGLEEFIELDTGFSGNLAILYVKDTSIEGCIFPYL